MGAVRFVAARRLGPDQAALRHVRITRYERAALVPFDRRAVGGAPLDAQSSQEDGSPHDSVPPPLRPRRRWLVHAANTPHATSPPPSRSPTAMYTPKRPKLPRKRPPSPRSLQPTSHPTSTAVPI